MTEDTTTTRRRNLEAYCLNWFQLKPTQLRDDVTILFDGSPTTIIFQSLNPVTHKYEDQTTHLTMDETHAMISGYTTVEAWQHQDQTQRLNTTPSFDIRMTHVITVDEFCRKWLSTPINHIQDNVICFDMPQGICVFANTNHQDCYSDIAKTGNLDAFYHDLHTLFPHLDINQLKTQKTTIRFIPRRPLYNEPEND